ncbi:MAG: DUF2330 domain-containing protein [Thermoplasmatota archaeon]
MGSSYFGVSPRSGLLLVISSMIVVSILPFVQGDGGFIPVSIQEVFESSQNSIITWDGETEMMCLSVNIYADEDTEGFHVVPFPSMPEVELGDIRIFDRYDQELGGFSEYYREGGAWTNDYDGLQGNTSAPKVEIMFEDTIGEHDVTVIRVNDMNGFEEELLAIVKEIGIDIEGYPAGLKQIIGNYTSRGFNYFSLDRYPIYGEEKSIEPLVYTFRTDSVVFPLEISSMLQGSSLVRLGIFTPPDLPLDLTILETLYSGLDRYYKPRPSFVKVDVLERIDPEISGMLPEGALLNYLEVSMPLFRIRGDLIIPRSGSIDWCRPHPFGMEEYREEDWELLDVEGTSQMLFFEKMAYHGHDARIVCINRSNGSTSWERSIGSGSGYGEEEIMHVTMFSEDWDGDGSNDLLLCRSDRWGTVIERLDPITGSALWSYGGEEMYYPEVSRVLYDSSGSPALSIIGPEFICAIEPSTGELVASYRTVMRNDSGYVFGGRINIENLHDLSWDGIGDGLLLHDNYRWIAWSPFHEHDGSYLAEDLSDDNVLWERMFGFHDITVQEGKDYILSVKYDDPKGEICYIDASDGSIDRRTPLRDWPEFWRDRAMIVDDLDSDGNGEVLAVYDPDDAVDTRLACFDPFHGERLWDVLLSNFDPRYTELNTIEVMDLDGDGEKEVLIHVWLNDQVREGEPWVFAVDSSNGQVLSQWSDTILLPYHPDMDGDGIPEIMIRKEDRWTYGMYEIVGGQVMDLPTSQQPLFGHHLWQDDWIQFIDLTGGGKELMISISSPYNSNIGVYVTSLDDPNGTCTAEFIGRLEHFSTSVSGEALHLTFMGDGILQGITMPFGERPPDVSKTGWEQSITFTDERYVGSIVSDDDDMTDDDGAPDDDAPPDDDAAADITSRDDDLDISPIATFSVITLVIVVSFVFVIRKWRRY